MKAVDPYAWFGAGFILVISILCLIVGSMTDQVLECFWTGFGVSSGLVGGALFIKWVVL